VAASIVIGVVYLIVRNRRRKRESEASGGDPATESA
jgi:hypothetical protein